MSSRLLSLLAALAAVLGLSALPAASLARSAAPTTLRQADDPTAGDDLSDLAADPTDLGDENSCDTTAADDASSDDTADDPAADDGSADDSSADDSADDPAADDASADDGTSDDSSSDDSTDAADDAPAGDDTSDGDCSTTADDPAPTTTVPAKLAAVRLVRTGKLTQRIVMPAAGTIDETLMAGSAVVGTKHLQVTRARTVTVHIKLNARGRKLVRTARRTVHLTLGTHVAVTGGQPLDRATALTIAPAHRPAANAHRKHTPRAKARHHH